MFNSIRSLILRPRLKRLTRLVCVAVPETEYRQTTVDDVPLWKGYSFAKKPPRRAAASAQQLSNTEVKVLVTRAGMEGATYPFTYRRPSSWSSRWERVDNTPPSIGRGDEMQLFDARPLAQLEFERLTKQSLTGEWS